MKAEVKIQEDVDFEPSYQIENLSYEAISRLEKDNALVFPEIIFSLGNTLMLNSIFRYDFKTKTKIEDIKLIANGMFPYRITDATDVDRNGDFWILAINRYQDPPYSDEKASFRSLIKAHLSQSTVTFVSRFNIGGTTTTPNFEALTQIGKDQFLILSDGFSVENNQGVVYVKIVKNKTRVKTLDVYLKGSKLSPQQFDDLQISGACNYKKDVIVLPQLGSFLYRVSCKNITQIKCGSKRMYLKPIKLTITGNQSEEYEGLEAITVDKRHNLLGLSEWTVDGVTIARPFTGYLR